MLDAGMQANGLDGERGGEDDGAQEASEDVCDVVNLYSGNRSSNVLSTEVQVHAGSSPGMKLRAFAFV
jgi:hypothetical protein